MATSRLYSRVDVTYRLEFDVKPSDTQEQAARARLVQYVDEEQDRRDVTALVRDLRALGCRVHSANGLYYHFSDLPWMAI